MLILGKVSRAPFTMCSLASLASLTALNKLSESPDESMFTWWWDWLVKYMSTIIESYYLFSETWELFDCFTLVNYTHPYQLTNDSTLTELIEYVITWYHLKYLLLIPSVPLWLVSHFSSWRIVRRVVTRNRFEVLMWFSCRISYCLTKW